MKNAILSVVVMIVAFALLATATAAWNDEPGPLRYIFGKYVVGGITVAAGMATYIFLLDRSDGSK